MAAAPGMTYAAAGVSIDAGNDLRSAASGVLFDLHAAGYDKAPILVQTVDGVGTKLKIAFAINKHDTVGIDLVAMNVNDLVVQGAEPISFLDYFACGKLDVDTAASFVEGVAKACKEAGCALVGGETAEMPGMYADGEYDAAGNATGVVGHGQPLLPDKKAMIEGDILLGLASNGVHSNGFSLVRRILEKEKLTFHDSAPWDRGSTVGESLLTPTRIYVKPCLELAKKGLVKGMAHITGGGILENIPRMLPDMLAAEVDISTWEVPAVLDWMKKAGNVADMEFARVFNTGIGMVLVVPAAKAEEATSLLQAAGEKVYSVGVLTEKSGKASIVLQNLESWE